MKIKLSDIKVSQRVRKDLGDIPELANSILRVGLIQPIVLDNDNNLIAGGRRLAAHIHLGRTEIEFITYDQADEITRKDIELEENLRRKDLEWPEEVLAIKKLYELRRERYGGDELELIPGKSILRSAEYSIRDAATELDRSKTAIAFDLSLAKGLEEFPEIAEEKSKSAAWKRYLRAKQTVIRAAQAQRTRVENIVPIKDDNDDEEDPADRIIDTNAASAPVAHEPRPQIKKIGWPGHGMLYLADSLELLPRMQAGTIDLIVTDPPFGLDLFREGQATSGARLAQHAGSMYDDDAFKVMNMLDKVVMHCARLLKPNGHAYFFFHMTKYEEMYIMLRKHFGNRQGSTDFAIEETPIMWIKNTPGIGDPNEKWVYAYEPCFFVNRGRHLIKPQAFNYLRYDTIPPNQKVHPTEKPSALLRHLISASALPGEVVLDPFAGSGSTLVACVELGCKFIGVEKHEPFHRSAVEKISESLGALQTEAEEIPSPPPTAA
jgi:DNA modification methylase/ParB-like chromosome segregation protein Spo0J